ncbi:Bloom syndrome protein [Galdieria sulphuraria]|uniref:ATP-dependent DNA helicase n=1 Tax=Galdieria sulphuraria TaxID=130081 RepID=M2WXJ2_GALSU|nr:ATP-dependent DNA helicase RecQ [Galdieria sulphuraria]EME28770.1 ATP-dependent DNA helicase RecQ [Galdieria sulphuraria]GJD07118.1 Bloom syndrome protein [Galdieria sulphuraria]|eukprot:XP_005705290.1 ATP-dependent DNA helicase RecQ [Galdieria sulphuraria]
MTFTRIENNLKKYFGYENFRPLQQEVITSVLEGKDVFFLAPTGGGKSLCFQLPALLLEGKVSFVISPLVALIEDQVNKLTALNIRAYSILSCQGKKHKERIFSLLEQSHKERLPSLIYLTPECVSTNRFQKLLKSLYRNKEIGLFAVDEAHCISCWGHDFRPKYRRLEILKQLCCDIPILALTATATKMVVDDIITCLGMKQCIQFRQSFNRPNIFYQVIHESQLSMNVMDDLKCFVSSFGNSSGIIYARQREVTEYLCQKLIASGIKAGVYHAGKKACEKQKTLKDWLSNDLSVICCTVAFGMGIDKPDVRFVIHFNLPKSLENFYQESGRAGRDGFPSCSRLYYSSSDFFSLQEMSRGKEYMPSTYLDKCSRGIEALYEFCNQPICRRKQLVKYFGETFSGICDSCDICFSKFCTMSPNSSVMNNLPKETEASLGDPVSDNRLASTFCTAFQLLAEEGRAKPKYREDNIRAIGIVDHGNHHETNTCHKRKISDDSMVRDEKQRRQTKMSKTQNINQKTLLRWFSETM